MTLRRFSVGVVAAACCIAVAASAMARDQAERHVHRRAGVGETVRVGGHVNYGRYQVACTAIPTTITVIQAPEHGTLEVHDEAVTTADPELGRAAKCLGANGLGEVVYYTRASAGADSFKYDSSSDNGVVHFTVTMD
jgi:hypothetical protein